MTKDIETRYKPNEREAIVRHNARVIQFTRGNWTSDMMIAAFTQGKKALTKLLNKQPGPFIARLNKKGEVTKVFTAQDLSGPVRSAPDGADQSTAEPESPPE